MSSQIDTAAVRTTRVDGPVDVSSLLPRGGLLWTRASEGLVAWGEAARVRVDAGPDRFERAAAAVEDLLASFETDDDVRLPGTGPIAFGSFTFDARAPGSVLVVPEVVVGRRGSESWITVVGDAAGPDLSGPRRPAPAPSERVRYAGSSISELEWLDAVADAVRKVEAGDVGKVVLARDVHVWSKKDFDIALLARRLAGRFAGCFTFVSGGLVGATPELLVRKTGRSVRSRPLAGSSARGRTESEDAGLGEALMASEKERAEHGFVVDSVVERLAPLCRDLRVDDRPSLVRLDNVQHLGTHISGELEVDVDALRLAGALHPTAAVCGAPTADALELIRALEHLDRGRYGGPVGWMDARGDGEWAIALRCADISGNRGRLFAGAGIVPGSVPEAELEETRLKLRAMQSALDPPGAE